MDLVEEEEVVIMAAMEAVATAVATAVVIMAAMAEAMAVVIIVAATAEAMVVVIIVAATAVAILNLMVLILINLLEQKVGKTEVMGILLKTLNMKVVGAEEKGECPVRAMLQLIQIRNPFPQAL